MVYTGSHRGKGITEVKEVEYFRTNALLVRNFERCEVSSRFSYTTAAHLKFWNFKLLVCVLIFRHIEVNSY